MLQLNVLRAFIFFVVPLLMVVQTRVLVTGQVTESFSAPAVLPELKQLPAVEDLTLAQDRLAPRQTKLQSGFPTELLLQSPTAEAVDRANRHVIGTIEPEIPLNLVIGRPKILQLARLPSEYTFQMKTSFEQK